MSGVQKLNVFDSILGCQNAMRHASMRCYHCETLFCVHIILILRNGWNGTFVIFVLSPFVSICHEIVREHGTSWLHVFSWSPGLYKPFRSGREGFGWISVKLKSFWEWLDITRLDITRDVHSYGSLLGTWGTQVSQPWLNSLKASDLFLAQDQWSENQKSKTNQVSISATWQTTMVIGWSLHPAACQRQLGSWRPTRKRQSFLIVHARGVATWWRLSQGQFRDVELLFLLRTLIYKSRDFRNLDWDPQKCVFPCFSYPDTAQEHLHWELPRRSMWCPGAPWSAMHLREERRTILRMPWPCSTRGCLDWANPFLLDYQGHARRLGTRLTDGV